LATLNEGIKMAERNGDHFYLPRLPNCVGWIHRELQDFSHAIEHDQHGVEIAREDRIQEAEANSLINLGIDYTHTGHDEKTHSAFSAVEAIFERDDYFRWRYNIRLQAGISEYWISQADLERAGVYARRLLETAIHHEARKYIATAHRLLARIAIARGDLGEGEKELNAALNLLSECPVPVVAWKTYAMLARLRLQLGDMASAHEAFAQAAAIVKFISGQVNDERLRSTFLNSAAAREVLDGAGETRTL
jgi:tetratricopeptide (TPR) repeat protein